MKQPDTGLSFDLVERARWRVVGGSEPYEVRREGDSFTCTCPGWRYRRRCRHVAELLRRRAARRVAR
jgi:SWIM zinc finger